jgi:hypothetical protein
MTRLLLPRGRPGPGRRPVDGGGEAPQLAHRALVVVLLSVPQGHVVPLDLGEPGLEGQDAFRLALGIRLTKRASMAAMCCSYLCSSAWLLGSRLR